MYHSNTTLVKVKFRCSRAKYFRCHIQIQLLLKLNRIQKVISIGVLNSNTTLVKVKSWSGKPFVVAIFNSNTTLVKVKYVFLLILL